VLSHGAHPQIGAHRYCCKADWCSPWHNHSFPGSIMSSHTSTTLSVPIHDVQAHVIFMKALRRLQHDLQPGGIPYEQQSSATFPSASALNFIKHAVQRFGVWLRSLDTSAYIPPLQREHIPPLDVLMVWHAYMLVPGAYYKGSLDASPVLAKLGGMPWDTIVCLLAVIELISHIISRYHISTPRRQFLHQARSRWNFGRN
jgi:hypothetical protein